MESFSSASYSKWDDDRAWSSQEWKTDSEMYQRSGRPDETTWRATRKIRPGFSREETLHDGTAQSVVNEVMPRDRRGRPDIDSQEGAWPQQFVIGNDGAELELSVESRSFVNRVNDQVRIRQKRISNVTENEEKHSMIWGMFITVTMESAVFMGKNYMNNCQSIANTTDLTLKQMFDISARLVSELDEISGMETIGCQNHSWKYMSLIGDERVINLQRTKVYVFSDSVLCLGKILEHPQSNDAWEQRLGWFKSSQVYRNFDRIDGEPIEFEWNIFPGFNTLQLNEEVKSLLFRSGETPENFTRRIFFMSMFNDISCGSRDNKKECESNANLVSLYAKRFGKGHWSFIGPGSEKKWYSISEDSPQGIWDKIAEGCCLNLPKADVQISVQRPHCPEVNSKAKDMENCRYTMHSDPRVHYLEECLKAKVGGKLSIHSCADPGTIEIVFRIILSVNQLSLYGAVAEICEEYESLHEKTERPVVGGQSSSSFVPSVIKTEVPLDCDDPANQDLLLQQYGERIEKLSQQDKLSKICLDAEFLSVVEDGQYFMTKDTADLTQFHAVACREYTLPRQEEASQPKGWIQGNTKIGPVLEVATCCLHGKY